MPAGAARPDPAIGRHRLGRELRRLREERSLRLQDVAARLGVAPSTLSRIETGKAPTRTVYLAAMLDLYGVGDPDQREPMADMARDGQRKGWWTNCSDLLAAGMDRYLGLEAAAWAVRAFAVDVVPGLVQTRGYATAVHAASRPDLTDDQAKRLAWLQTRRKEMLPDAAELHLVLDEAVLRRTIGAPGVMTAQLEYLLAVAAWPSTTVQVLSLADARPVLSDSITVLSFADPADSSVACYGRPGGQVIITRHAAQVRAAHATFAALSQAAMPPARSADLIRDQARG